MTMYVVEIINSKRKTRLGVFSYEGDRIDDIGDLINECCDNAEESTDEDFDIKDNKEEYLDAFDENFRNNLEESGFTDLELEDTFFYKI